MVNVDISGRVCNVMYVCEPDVLSRPYIPVCKDLRTGMLNNVGGVEVTACLPACLPLAARGEMCAKIALLRFALATDVCVCVFSRVGYSGRNLLSCGRYLMWDYIAE